MFLPIGTASELHFRSVDEITQLDPVFEISGLVSFTMEITWGKEWAMGRLLPFCVLTFSMLPVASRAQSKDSSNPAANNDVVSVHELSIPDSARRNFNKGVRRLSEADWSGSIPEFKKAIRIDPSFFEAYDMLGVAQSALQNWGDAEAAFRKSIELSHDTYGPPHFGLGLVLCVDRKQLADAEAVIREGLDMDPADAQGHFTLAWVLYTAEQFRDAERSAREAVLCKPNFQEAYLLLAQVHIRLNDWSAVIEDLDGYLKLDPASPRSARMRGVRAHAELVRSQNDGASGQESRRGTAQ